MKHIDHFSRLFKTEPDETFNGYFRTDFPQLIDKGLAAGYVGYFVPNKPNSGALPGQPT